MPDVSENEGIIQLSKDVASSLVSIPTQRLSDLPEWEPDESAKDKAKSLFNFATEDYKRLQQAWYFYLIATILNLTLSH